MEKNTTNWRDLLYHIRRWLFCRRYDNDSSTQLFTPAAARYHFTAFLIRVITMIAPLFIICNSPDPMSYLFPIARGNGFRHGF
jgi:hypothetical protein